MDETFQAILDTLPPKPARSRLEPYAELIYELRRRGRSYREITAILANRCDVRVGVHTLYNFVRVRTKPPKKTNRSAKAAPPGPGPAVTSIPDVAASSGSGDDGGADVWQRIQALKDRSISASTQSAGKVFHYDEDSPLTVTRKKDEV